MQAIKIRSGASPLSVHVVGENFMTLQGRYDPNQMWFSFMDRAVFLYSEPGLPQPYKKFALPKNKFVQLEGTYLSLYPPEADPNQLVLPFREGKRLSNKQANKEKASGFRTWDRKSDGELYTVSIRSGEIREEIEEWLKDNCQRRFILKSNHTIVFESAVDAINGKMKFS
jgi:hypothetical protein